MPHAGTLPPGISDIGGGFSFLHFLIRIPGVKMAKDRVRFPCKDNIFAIAISLKNVCVEA